MAAQQGLSLLNLENKTRQQPKIAHEQGAGSQCTKCGPKCAGFDLHYWRKICRNCRCGKENHLVTDEDQSSRLVRLLDSPFSSKTEHVPISLKGSPTASRPTKLTFSTPAAVTMDAPSSPLDWVPPTADSQLAAKYIEQLPVAKQPITGSKAAVDRKIALDRQLPSHDLDPDQCQSLSADEKRKMEEYVKNVKQYVVGQGLIQECPPRMGKLPPPPPQLGRILGEKVSQLTLQESAAAKPIQNRPIPSFVTAKPFVKAEGSSAEQIRRMAAKPHAGMDTEQFNDLPPPPPDMLMENPPSPAPPLPPAPPPPIPQLTMDSDNPAEQKRNRRQDPVMDFLDFLDEQEGKKLPGKLKSPFLHQAAASGTFNATARPFGASPGTSPKLNQRNKVGVTSSAGVAAVAGVGTATGSRGSSPRLGARDGIHIPPTSGSGSLPTNSNQAPRRLLTTDFDYFPEEVATSNANNNQVPIIPNINNNNNQSPLTNRRPSGQVAHPLYEQQHPSSVQHQNQQRGNSGQDNNKHVTAQIPPPVQRTSNIQQEVVFQDPEAQNAWSCRKCSQPIEAGTVAIFAERAGSDKCWHPQCFQCSICHEMLADLIYFFVDDNMFCGRHYAEQMKIPRCKACDELIFAPEYTSAEGASWHMDHFCCWLCDTPLAGHQYTPIEGQPHCLDCYQKKYGKDCYECNKPIRAEETRVSHGEMNWHNTASCFKCRQCQVSMMNRQFVLKNGQIYCSRECIVQHSQCQAQSVLV